MGKIVLRVVFLASLALNVAFAVYLILTFCPMNSRFNTSDPRLSRQQIRDMKEIRRQMLPRYEALQQKRDRFQEELVALLKMEPSDRERIHSCIENIGVVQKEIRKLNVEEILACKRFLSDRQCGCLLDRGAKKTKMSCEGDKGCSADSK
jgi:hypothetical protein